MTSKTSLQVICNLPTTAGEAHKLLPPRKMEELKHAIRTLENNFKDVIDCHSKNLETLKNFTLELNERVRAIEKTVIDNKEQAKDLIVEKIEAVQEELANLDTKLDSVEEDLQGDIEKNAARIDDEKSQSLRLHKDQSRKIENLLEENSRKLNEVEANMLNQKEVINNVESYFKCEECDESFRKKHDMRKHINNFHPKFIKCDYCDETFNESWKYETHLECHGIEKKKKCDVCGKEFYLEWRFKQHMNIHENPKIKNCHYYNNNKVCPFDQVGCKFKHMRSKQCENQANCKNKLCPNQHIVIQNIVH